MISIVVIIVIIGGEEGDPLGIRPSFFRDDNDDLNLHFFNNKKFSPFFLGGLPLHHYLTGRHITYF